MHDKSKFNQLGPASPSAAATKWSFQKLLYLSEAHGAIVVKSKYIYTATPEDTLH